MDRVSSNIIKNDFNKEKEKQMKKTAAKKIVKGSDTYKLDRVKSFVKIEQKGTITAKEAIENIADILEVQPIIKLNKETSYRCVEAKTYGKHEGKGYFLQYKWWEHDEWCDVTDLTELKVWEYNELVDKLQKHYPDYPIEYLEGRFV